MVDRLGCTVALCLMASFPRKSPLKASSTVASQSPLTFNGLSGYPVQLHSLSNRYLSQGATWLSRGSAPERLWGIRVTLTLSKLRHTRLRGREVVHPRYAGAPMAPTGPLRGDYHQHDPPSVPGARSGLSLSAARALHTTSRVGSIGDQSSPHDGWLCVGRSKDCHNSKLLQICANFP